MQLPSVLQMRIEQLFINMKPNEVRSAAEVLSLRYRMGEKAPDGTRLLTSEQEMRAYCAFRMPSTYACVHRALEITGVTGFRTLTDVGSGTGCVLWAAEDFSEGLERADLLERESGMIALAKELAQEKDNVRWTQGDMRKMDIPKSELVTASFTLGELAPEDAEKVVKRLWEATERMLLIVEPGTPAGFARIRKYMELLKDLGGNVAAPCPETEKCPITGEDWCHFTVRVERSRLHKYLKDGEAPYEDEKFCFVAVTREKVTPAGMRIRRRPLIEKGCVTLPVCCKEGIKEIKVTRKNERFKTARKAEVGDVWE